MGLREALEDVEIGFRQLEFAIKLLSYCELENIKPADFDTDHLVQLPDGNLRFPSGSFATTDDLVRAASIGVVLAFGASTLVLDQAFEAAGVRSNADATDNTSQLRLLVYMVRCAHAHGIADPRWDVRGRKARKVTVQLDGTTLTLDLAALNGQPFNIDRDLGGYANWYLIRRIAVQSLSTANAA